MLILLDQDGVLANFDKAFYAAWQASGYDYPGIPPAQRTTFYVRDNYPKNWRKAVEEIYTAPGFFLSLPPIDGAQQAVREMLEEGHDVRICTSPLNDYRNCVAEKYLWMEEHFGSEMVARMIVSKDKTLVHGDLLIDDKPRISGSRSPSWQHVIFDQPYNRQAQGPRINWSNWRAVLAQLSS